MGNHFTLFCGILHKHTGRKQYAIERSILSVLDLFSIKVASFLTYPSYNPPPPPPHTGARFGKIRYVFPHPGGSAMCSGSRALPTPSMAFWQFLYIQWCEKCHVLFTQELLFGNLRIFTGLNMPGVFYFTLGLTELRF